MRLRFISILLTWLLSACATRSTPSELSGYSYIDSIQFVRKVNCGSFNPTHCMACALQGEAANQPALGIYAVGVTIMTRSKANLKRVCRVTKANHQFEGMNSKGYRKISRKVWGITQKIIQTKETGWTHFWAPVMQAKLKRKKPHWVKTFERKRCENKRIGDHEFFDANNCKIKKLKMSEKTAIKAKTVSYVKF